MAKANGQSTSSLLNSNSTLFPDRTSTVSPAQLERMSAISTFSVSRLEHMLPPSNGHSNLAYDVAYLASADPGTTPALVLGHRDVQFCPTCLLQDSRPYFRKIWALDLAVACEVHGTALLDRCSECGRTISLTLLMPQKDDLTTCTHCGHDLRQVPAPSTVRDELTAFQRDLLSLDAAVQISLNPKVQCTGFEKATFAQALFTLTRRYLMIQYFDAASWRLTEWHEADIVSESATRRVGAASLVAWALEDYPARLYRLIHLANDRRSHGPRRVRRDAAYFTILQLIQRSAEGELVRALPTWLERLPGLLQGGKSPFRLTDEQWKGAQAVLVRALRPRGGSPLNQPRAVVEQLLDYLSGSRSWPQVARTGFKGGVLCSRLEMWRASGAVTRLILYLHDDLTDRGDVDLTHLVLAWQQDRDPYDGDWRSQTAALLLAPRTLALLQVELPSLHQQLVKTLLARRRRRL